MRRALGVGPPPPYTDQRHGDRPAYMNPGGPAVAEVVLDWQVAVDGPRVLTVVVDGRRVTTDTLPAGVDRIDTLAVRRTLPLDPGSREIRVSFDPVGVMSWSAVEREAALQDTVVVPPLQVGRRVDVRGGARVLMTYDATYRFLQIRLEGE